MEKIFLILIFFSFLTFVVAENLTLNESLDDTELMGDNFTMDVNESSEINLNFSDNSTEDTYPIEANITNEIDLNFSDNFSNVSFDGEAVLLEVLNFVIFVFVEGEEYSLELFEFLLGANSGEGEEYAANLILDEQSTPNRDAKGNEYSLSVGGYGFLSAPLAIISSYCGDGNCDSGENCSSCSSDCGECPSAAVTGGRGGFCGEGYLRVEGKCVFIEKEIDEVVESIVKENDTEAIKDLEEELEEDGERRRGITGEVIAEGLVQYPVWITVTIILIGIIFIIYFKVRRKVHSRKKEYVYKKQFRKISGARNPRIKYKKSRYKTLDGIKKLVE